ncbi:MAG: phosphoribosylformimino-5-aminoimidazole carboxamide ribotide isomerase [Limisphaerales bacterium]
MFRPCIDLHEGRVKQIVGGSLDTAELRTNFVSEKPSAWFAELYRRDYLRGGHVIMLGAGNEPAALEALRAYPGGLQIGGGINPDNAQKYLDAGASHVIVTSWIFREGRVEWDRLKQLVGQIGQQRLVLDLSCRKRDGQYFVVTDRWQKFTTMSLSAETLASMAQYCDEFLIHAVDVEGLCRGIDQELVEKLSRWTNISTTYAGGARLMADLETVTQVSANRIDLTIGSALDIFGGSGIAYRDCVKFNQTLAARRPVYPAREGAENT